MGVGFHHGLQDIFVQAQLGQEVCLHLSLLSGQVVGHVPVVRGVGPNKSRVPERVLAQGRRPAFESSAGWHVTRLGSEGSGGRWVWYVLHDLLPIPQLLHYRCRRRDILWSNTAKRMLTTWAVLAVDIEAC